MPNIMLRLAEVGAEELLKQVPGAVAIRGVLREASRERREGLGNQFFATVATQLAESGVDHVLVETILQEEWATEAFERGYQAIMEALDPQARACIAVLVAQYLENKIAPNRSYKRVAALLSDCTARDLEPLRLIATSVMKLAHLTAWRWGRVRLSAEDKAEGATMWIAANDGKGGAGVIGPLPAPPNLEDVVQLLRQNNIGQIHEGWSGEGHGNERVIFQPGEHIEGVDLMLRCIGSAPAVPDVIYTSRAAEEASDSHEG